MSCGTLMTFEDLCELFVLAPLRRSIAREHHKRVWRHRRSVPPRTFRREA